MLKLGIRVVLTLNDLVWLGVAFSFALLNEVDVLVDRLLHKLAHLVSHER